MQGQLRKETLAVTIDTQCAHCDRSLQITVASDMDIKVRDRNAEPLVFMPTIDWTRFREPNIIHAY